MNANGTGTSFNGAFSTGFTTWTLKNWDLTAYPVAITDINSDPTPASGTGFTAGGFDAPRTVSATNAFWKAWSWDCQDQGNTYPTGNPTAPAFGFRQVMLRNFVNDVMAWIQAEGITGDVITAHQIPTEMVSAERNRSSASPIWTGLSKINGTVGLTRYGSTTTAQVALITQYTSNWGCFEWHVKPSETDNVVLHDRAVTELARFYASNCRIVCPFSWATGVGGVGAGIPYPVKGCGFAAGIKEWMDAQVAAYTPTVSSVADQTVNESTATSVLGFTIGDDTTPAGSLIVTVASSNTALVPVANIVLGGSGANRTVTVTPVANQSGTATITLTVSDGTFTTSTTFLITVNAVSDSRIKGPSGTQLNLGTAWNAGLVPLDPDVAVWESTSRTGSFTPGGALNWGGLTVLNPTAPITFNGASALTLGSAGVNLSAATTDLTVNLPLVLGTNQSWSVAASRMLTANGVISGSGILAKTGAGMVALSGINTFTGAVTVSSGPLRVANSAALGTNNGTITSNVASGRVLVLAGSGSNVVNGVIRDGSGAASVTVQGGAWTLAASNTCTGATTVSGGTLHLTGSLASAVTVSGGVLSGTGTVSGNVAINGGTHAPGNSAGIMTLNGNYALASGGALQIEINGPAVGTQYDQVKLAGAAGAVTLAGTLNVIAAGGLAAGTTFIIIDKTSAGAVSGTFAGKANGSAFVASGYTWIISCTAGDGNDVTLTVATPQQAWRFTYFATIASTASNDLTDSNNDGETPFLKTTLKSTEIDFPKHLMAAKSVNETILTLSAWLLVSLPAFCGGRPDADEPIVVAIRWDAW